MILDTESEPAWRQYAANCAFARTYQPRSAPRAGGGGRPRVLVTGFGPFGPHPDNASGMMVSRWLAGEVAPPLRTTGLSPALAVATGVVALEGVGEVDVCAMVLPVSWDLAPLLVLREAEAFEPELVLMNGIGAPRQPLFIELGAINQAKRVVDGSGVLAPLADRGPVVVAGELARPNLARWGSMARAASDALAREVALDPSLAEVAPSALLAGFPRVSNSYVCNDTTYAVGYALDHGQIALMGASHRREGDDGIELSLGREMSHVARLFVHWPSDLVGAHLDAGARVMKAIAAGHLAGAEPALRGDRAAADLAPDFPGESTH